MAIAPGPTRSAASAARGWQAGSSSSLTEDSVIFRIEYAPRSPPTGPRAGPRTRVSPTGVYSGGTGAAPYAYENPFRPRDLPRGDRAVRQPGRRHDVRGRRRCHAAARVRGGVRCRRAPAARRRRASGGADPCRAVAGPARRACAPQAYRGARRADAHVEARAPRSGHRGVRPCRLVHARGADRARHSDALTLELRDGGRTVSPTRSPAAAERARLAAAHRAGMTYRERRRQRPHAVKLRRRPSGVFDVPAAWSARRLHRARRRRAWRPGS